MLGDEQCKRYDHDAFQTTVYQMELWVVLYVFTHTIDVLVGLAFLSLPLDTPGVVVTLSEVLVIGVLFSAIIVSVST
jgi:hypothetical protein